MSVRLWIVAPTQGELDFLTTRIQMPGLKFISTGIGMVNTALGLERALQKEGKPDWIIQAGIAGSWTEAFPIGSVVQVRKEIYGELGAESPEGFKSLEVLGFVNFRLGDSEVHNVLENPHPALNGLPQATGITVNRVHGITHSIEETRAFWHPEIESMEGAAFFQVCLQWGIPFAEIRSVSNRVEPRNRDAWNIPLALNTLSGAVKDAAVGLLFS